MFLLQKSMAVTAQCGYTQNPVIIIIDQWNNGTMYQTYHIPATAGKLCQLAM